ncbi:hypothetical protein BDQ17DRAFT_1100393 [Cyathus striatus]|nr:hypothetical protein BDQ17DRAFT_1100393 [Cyathus striatus]
MFHVLRNFQIWYPSPTLPSWAPTMLCAPSLLCTPLLTMNTRHAIPLHTSHTKGAHCSTFHYYVTTGYCRSYRYQHKSNTTNSSIMEM